MTGDWFSGPIAQIVFRFHISFHIVWQSREEVHGSDAFHLVHRVDILVALVVAGFVLVDEAYGTGIAALHAGKNHFEEGIGDAYLERLAYVTILWSAVVDGAAHYVDGFHLCPAAASLLQLLPVATVQIVVLRTDVGHVETLVHSTPMVLVVAGRAHVSPIPSATGIFLCSNRLVLGKFGIGHELAVATLPLYQFLLVQFPCHPVGDTLVGVVDTV